MMEWGIISTVLILAIIVVRRCCKGKIPCGLQYGLWLLVLVRLLVPVTPIESSLSILNFIPRWEENSSDEDTKDGKEEYKGNITGDTAFFSETYYGTEVTEPDGNNETHPVSVYSIEKSIYLVNELMEPADAAGKSYNPVKKTAEMQLGKSDTVLIFLYGVWLAGAAIMAVFFVAVNITFYIRLKKSAVLTGTYEKIKVYDTGEVVSPCLFGLFAPAVYLDGSKIVSEQEKEHILLHEATHYKHRDYIWALLRAVCICLHWYNPVVWYAAFVSEKDCELACDESVIKKIGEENRIAYGETLLKMICQSRRISNVICTATTMVGTKKSIKERIESVAEKNKFSMAAFLFLMIVMLMAAACTFTGKDSKAEDKAFIKKIEEKLFENEEYTAKMKRLCYPADYDGDGVEEAFLFVKAGDGEENTDIFYYEDGNLSVYKTDKNVELLESNVYVMELSGKTFCVYDEKTDMGIVSRVLGIRDGKIINYFMDYTTAWENDRYIVGRVHNSEGNDIDVITYKNLANATMHDDGHSEESLCTMTEYFYYDEKKDCITRYPVYAITKEEVLSMEGGKEALDEFKQADGEADYGYYSYAKNHDKLFLMVVHSYSSGYSSYAHSTYEYSEEENRVGNHVETGEGRYEYLEEQSYGDVFQYEQDKFNACYEFVEDYEKGITCDGVILSQNEQIGDENALIRTYEWTKNNEILVHITEIWYEYVNGEVRLTEGKQPVTTSYGEIRSLGEFEKVYCNGEYVEKGNILIPDLFIYNLQTEIADQNISKYMDAQTALLAYFHFSGGAVSRIDYKMECGVEICVMEYEFADKSRVTVELYEDYRGVWSVMRNQYGISAGYSKNVWYAGLTEDVLKTAVPAKNFSFDSDKLKPVIVMEDRELDVSVYYAASASSYGMLVRSGDTEYLLPVVYDMQNLPEFSHGDYDGDGKTELSVINCAGRGSGVYWESLSIIDSAYQPYDRAYHLLPEDVYDMIADRLVVVYDKENSEIKLSLAAKEENQELTLYLKDFMEEMKNSGESGELENLVYGNHCYMSCANDIINCDVFMEYVPDGWVTGYDLPEVSSEKEIPGWIRVQVRYLGNGQFAFEDIFFLQENTPW